MFKKLKQWWRNTNEMFIQCDTDTSTVMLSKKLYESMRSDHPKDDHFDALFAKMRSAKPNGVVKYALFFNPQWEKHGITNPKSIQTIPVTISNQGHVGFQSVQPSMLELAVMYGMPDGKFTLKVSRQFINDEPYYLIDR